MKLFSGNSVDTLTSNPAVRSALQTAKEVILDHSALSAARNEVESSVQSALDNPIQAIRELDRARSMAYPNNVITMGKILALCPPNIVRWLAEDYISQMEECARNGEAQHALDESGGLLMASQIGWILILVNPNPSRLSPQFVAWRDAFSEARYNLVVEVIHDN